MNLPNGCKVIRYKKHDDNRGSFQRIIESDTLPLDVNLSQISLSTNKLKGTLRGLHYQKSQSSEYKFVRCVKGEVFDVILDVRPKSQTFLTQYTINLVEDDGVTLLLPPGIAHGFLTLSNDSSILYGMTSQFDPDDYSGVNWEDPLIKHRWPFHPLVISEQDKTLPFISRN